jgi:2-succinyl-5-enolpyruvyl-6-hydroxy-3-cyclohexene-1-carboxylate synthase
MADRLADTGTTNCLWGTLLIEELVRLGLRQVVLAPGSRSTPLTLAAARHPRLKVVVHYDERGVGFAALGMARASGLPVAVICTSGSALANLMPAVVEANLDAVPLLLLTADRPPELRQVGANQTMDQVNFFGQQVRWAADFPCPGPGIPWSAMLGLTDEAWRHATTRPPGPVHLNLMLREPLLPAPDQPLAGMRSPAAILEHCAPLLPARWLANDQPFWQPTVLAAPPQPCDLATLVAGLQGRHQSGHHGLLLVGKLETATERQAVVALAQHLQWPLFPDLLSGLRLGPDSPQRLAYADLLLLPGGPAHGWQPELILHLGGRFIAKRLLSYLDQSPAPRWQITADPRRYDPQLRGGRAWCGPLAPILDACREALPAANSPVAALSMLRQAQAQGGKALATLLDDPAASLTEPAVARALSRLLPAGHHLLVAASLPVRELDSYGATDGPLLQTWSNRGASGIDGTIATAAGLAHGSGQGVAILIGDLALLHDLNSLAMLRDLPVLVVVLNNDGGGIFEFLPVAREEDAFERCFAVSHGLRFADAAKLFGLHYASPATLTELQYACQQALAHPGPTLLEIRTERQANHRFQRELQAAFLAAATGAEA